MKVLISFLYLVLLRKIKIPSELLSGLRGAILVDWLVKEIKRQ